MKFVKTKNMKIDTLLYAGLTILLIACGPSETVDNPSDKDTASIVPIVEEKADDRINLDNGSKWKVDEKMMSFINEIETNAIDFSKNAKEKSMEMYQQLSTSINNNLDSLTSNCTMSGQAHDELHKWLLPFLELSEEFSISETLAESDSLYNQILNSLGEFHEYFE
jgi:hypothetical protein